MLQITIKDVIWFMLLIAITLTNARIQRLYNLDTKQSMEYLNDIDSRIDDHKLQLHRHGTKLRSIQKELEQREHMQDFWIFTVFRHGTPPKYDGYTIQLGDYAITIQGLSRHNGATPEFAIYCWYDSLPHDLFRLQFE